MPRTVTFAPRIAHLLEQHLGADVFRLEPDTVGIAGPGQMDQVLRSRPAQADERPTFKPVRGRLVERATASRLMQAVSADVRAALAKDIEPENAVDLSGTWPTVAHNYLRDLVFGAERLRFRILVDRRLELTPKLTWSAVMSGAATFRKPDGDGPLSHLATMVYTADSYRERQYAMYLYRRVAAPICFTVAALVTNAVWLGAPFADDISNRHLIHESLRLLPPSWNILRNRSPEFPGLDERIGPGDDLLLLPLLSHRDPRSWEAPHEWRPERWASLDPDTHPGYLPFGHASERCWGRHMVMPLAERVLDIVRRDGYTVDPDQRAGRVELDGLLEVSAVRMIRPAVTRSRRAG